MYYDLDGNEISSDRFMELRRDRDKSRIGADEIGEYWVSTVWMGLDHGYGEGPPIIFETMTFGGGGANGESLNCFRYATKEEAEAGHKSVVEQIKNGTPPEEVEV